jgi:plastocyanin
MVLTVLNLLPEQQASRFNPLSETPIRTDFRVLKTPSPGNNTYIYALNDVAEEALRIAQNDVRVKQIISEQKDKAMTIAAVQPTVILDERNSTEKPSYEYATGQIIIVANSQYIDGKPYSIAEDFNEIGNKTNESHQRIWNIFVDLNKETVSKISEDSERVIRKTMLPNLIYPEVNVFMPDLVNVNAGSEIKWPNNSNLPHNVVGTYKKTISGSQSQSQQNETVDSGFIQPGESWNYVFNNKGILEYHCTIHSANGMKGTIIVS